jgi:uncharacterized protein
MSVRAIPADFDRAVVAGIDARLNAVKADEDVRILWAAESGSRAWGFPSPDSDYDVRFLYVRRRDAYLSLWPPRDVIETPLDAIFDVNGWDLGKALKLLLKGNAVVFEWLTSPIVYRGDPAFREAMLDLARRHGDRRGLARHYLHLGVKQRDRHMPDGGGDVGVKKLFYVLRPAAVLRWLRLHPGEIVPPMHLPTLIAESGVSVEVRDAVADLIARKAAMAEGDRGDVPAVLATFIAEEFGRAAGGESERGEGLGVSARREANAVFARWVSG